MAWAASWCMSCGTCPAADVNLLKVPASLPDSKVVLLSDVLPTAWHATELGAVSDGDRVAIWGAGPGMRCQGVPRTAALNGHRA